KVVNGLRIFFFFFQAEDGIRDLIVTGVQTCALPISILGSADDSAAGAAISQAAPQQCLDLTGKISLPEMVEWIRLSELMISNDRSEERRVGKECRTRGVADHENKKE